MTKFDWTRIFQVIKNYDTELTEIPQKARERIEHIFDTHNAWLVENSPARRAERTQTMQDLTVERDMIQKWAKIFAARATEKRDFQAYAASKALNEEWNKLDEDIDFLSVLIKQARSDSVVAELGIQVLLCAHLDVGLKLNITNPPNRASGPPQGDCFPFVIEVMAQAGFSVRPTTLEGWRNKALKLLDGQNSELSDSRLLKDLL